MTSGIARGVSSQEVPFIEADIELSTRGRDSLRTIPVSDILWDSGVKKG